MNPKDRNLNCLRCGTAMKFIGQESFQLGEESFFSGIFAKMNADSASMAIYRCPTCRKLEFFDPTDE